MGCCKTLDVAKELHDRQSNAFAQTTFSEKVQREMEVTEYNNEAEGGASLFELGIKPSTKLLYQYIRGSSGCQP